MDWKQALTQIKSLEGAGLAATALETELNRLTNANFELTKDLRTANTKASDSSAKLTDLLTLLGAEGEDLKTQVEAASVKAKKLQADIHQIHKEKTDIEEKYKTADEERNSLKRRTTIQEAAQKTGAAFDVLATLTKDLPIESIAIDSDGVAVISQDGKEKKALREYAEANWAAFVPALFPAQKHNLPGGNPGGNKQEENLLATYRASTYDKTIAGLRKPDGKI